MATKVVDAALDKLSKKYPNFSADSGRKVVDSLQDAYKSFRTKKKENPEVKSAPENAALIDIPSDVNAPKPSSDKRGSFYENLEDYLQKNPGGEESLKKFPSEKKGVAQSTAIDDGDTSDASYQSLSDNSTATATVADSEKKELVCEFTRINSPTRG